MRLPTACGPTLADIRAAMDRPFTPEERAAYRGITLAAMTGVKYEKLFNVDNANELIQAEQDSITLEPSDSQGILYVFAKEYGIIASLNNEYVEQSLPAWGGKLPLESETLAELNRKYKSMKIRTRLSDEETEKLLQGIAEGVLAWWNNGQILG